ncbi:MAG: hypothetical protein L0H54_08150 [Alcaligenaceae bacterium]|nr:hypothetical protein [Alcaligenaceae bacterium]
MRYAVIFGVLVVLAGCAGQPGVVPLSTLETPGHMVTMRRLPMNFPAIQQALFKHEAACGQTYTFQAAPNSLNQGRVIYRPTPDAGWDTTLLIDLLLYQNLTVRARAYSYYSGQEDAINRMFAAMLHPEVCSGASSYPPVTKGFFSDGPAPEE